MKSVCIALPFLNLVIFLRRTTSGLDPHTANLFDELISEITSNSHETVVVTHDMNSVLEIGQKIYFLYKGKLWWEGNRDNILLTDNTELKAFVFNSELTKRLRPS
jgi:phospholipid/cholesterol/gamma-HCH transport system ATP-binding protein